MPASIAEKLQIKPDQALALMNAPAGYSEMLAQALPANRLLLMSGEVHGQVEALLLFVNTLAEAVSLAQQVIREIDPQTLWWVAYPKGGSKVKTDVNRDTLREMLAFTGWRPVRQVALDETWSAMRFRPAEVVGK